MLTRSDILSRLVDVITQVTLAEKGTVTANSQLYEDLGVESMDFIDIVFNCETEFGIEIQNDSIFTDRDFLREDSGNFADGQLTDHGLEALASFPYLNQEKLRGVDVQSYLYSVEMMVDYLEYRLQQAA